MVMDSVRTVVIWVFGLAFFGEKFQYLQIIGFVLLLSGTVLYNEVIVIPFLGRPEPKKVKEIEADETSKPLLVNDAQTA